MASKSFLQKTLEILAVLHITTNMTIVNFSCVLLYMYLLFFSSYWYIAALYSLWLTYDRYTPVRAGRNLQCMRKWSFWKYLASYFPITLHKTVDLDPSKNYIFAFHPHGLFVFGGFTNFATNGTGFDELFPGITMHFTVLNGQFQFPFYRDYLISNGFSSGNPESIDYKLSKIGPGHSVWLAVGGAAEVLLIEPNAYILKLKYRKGFIRRVLKTGASVVPVFSFNETRAYDLTYPTKGSATYYLQQGVKMISNLTLPVDVHGEYPWSWIFIPCRRPINTVVGRPMDFANLKPASFLKGQDPSDELVDKCHQAYLEALTKLFDDNKARFGDENTKLVFV